MRFHEAENTAFDTDRFARMDALYQAYCQRAETTAPGEVPDEAAQVVEVPCELAPSVRRRTRRLTH
jgi:hypothetical protein